MSDKEKVVLNFTKQLQVKRNNFNCFKMNRMKYREIYNAYSIIYFSLNN